MNSICSQKAMGFKSAYLLPVILFILVPASFLTT